MSLITILGASGFIGSHLVAALRARNAEHLAPGRKDPLPQQNLGDVIYSIGVTADFRSKPFETVDAHVCKLLEVLRNCEFNSLTYLSSTRLYANSPDPATEDDSVTLAPQDPNDLYNISKAMGESLALNCGKKARVVRLSNVYGNDFSSDNFLPTIIREAVTTGKVTLHTAPESAKDYVSIEDVLNGLIEISTRGRKPIYNLASGTNVTNGELAEEIGRATGCSVVFAPDAPHVSYPPISNARLRAEFDFKPRAVLEDLVDLVAAHRESLKKS